MNDLLHRKVLLVTGKGGIGKTLISTALAQAAAALGKRVLLLEFGAIDQISPLFGVPRVGHERLEVAPQLFCANIDPNDNFRDFVVKYLGQKKLFDKVISHRVVQTFIKTIPGLAELMMLGRLYFEGTVAPGARFDLIIFDGPASGHFLSMMTTPDAVLASNIVGPLRKETERVRSFLAQKDEVGCLYVTVPEELVISEALDFIPQLQAKSPVALAGVLVNKVPRMWCGSYGEIPDDQRYALDGFESPQSSLGLKSQIAYGNVIREARLEFFEHSQKALRLFDQEVTKGLLRGVEGEGPTKKKARWDLPDLFSIQEPLEADLWQRLLAFKGGPLAP